MKTVEEMNERLQKSFLSADEFISELKKDRYDTAKASEWDASANCRIVKTYINLPASFDIETTQIKETESSFMYIWMLNINGLSTSGRTWKEFEKVINRIRNVFLLNDTRILPIYVHNLGFEMSFMMPRYYKTVNNFFALDTHEPVRVEMLCGFEFRDSLKLSGMSLARTAENLTLFKIKKMVGDLDYSKIRSSQTEMTEKELGYCLHDVTTLTAYIHEQIEQYGDVCRIPLTNTGRVREYVREHCLYKYSKKGNKRRNNDFFAKVSCLTLDRELYALCKMAFSGGFTHAGHYNAGEVMNNVYSKDFTSSYPAVMVSEKFPATQPEYHNYKSIDEYDADIKKGYGILAVVEFDGISDEKFPYEHYISKSKARNKDIGLYLEDNGRLVEAEKMIMVITEQDMDIIRKTYNVQNITIIKAYRYKMEYLPKEYVECVLNLYEDKTTLKDVEGKEAEYQLKKGMLNSLYGMMVTDVINNEISWNHIAGWKDAVDEMSEREKQEYVDDCIAKYNKSKKRFSYYLWGVYITAYARHNLWEGIQELKEDYCYSDTDSVKYLNYDKHEEFFRAYNNRITAKIQALCKYYNIDESKASPLTVKGERKPLGVWDYEGYYDKFKTLGAKRYIINGFHRPDGSMKQEHMITIAGVNKKTGCEYIFSQKKPFDFFNDNMYIDAEHSGKTAVKYRDFQYSGMIDGEYMEEYGGAYVYATDYNMNMAENFKEYLEQGRQAGSNLYRSIRNFCLL